MKARRGARVGKGGKRCKRWAGKMATLPSKVPDHTIKLIALEVVTMLELGLWSWMSRRHGRSMPEGLIMLDLGRGGGRYSSRRRGVALGGI